MVLIPSGTKAKTDKVKQRIKGALPGRGAASSPSSSGRHTKDLAGETFSLAVAYAKQETLGPLKQLVRFVLWGVIGAVLITVSGVLFTLATVRLLQTEAAPHLDGDLSWVPYVGGVIVAAVFIVLAVSRISKVPARPTSDSRRDHTHGGPR